MKVILRDEQTQLFLGPGNMWLRSASEAQDLIFSLRAKSIAQQMNVARFQVLFYFPDLNYQIMVLDSQFNAPTAGQTGAPPA